MDWIDQMPDEAFKALIIAGPCLAILAGVLFAHLEVTRTHARRVAHGILCLGGLSLGAGVLIGAIRESEKLSRTAITTVAIGVLTTTLLYVGYIIGGSSRLGVATVVLALCTIFSAVLLGLSVNTEKCGCGDFHAMPAHGVDLTLVQFPGSNDHDWRSSN